MGKILVLQLDKLAADALRYQVIERCSFVHFLDLRESSSIPDAKTIWLCRDGLAKAGTGTLIFEQIQIGRIGAALQALADRRACCLL